MQDGLVGLGVAQHVHVQQRQAAEVGPLRGRVAAFAIQRVELLTGRQGLVVPVNVDAVQGKRLEPGDTLLGLGGLAAMAQGVAQMARCLTRGTPGARLCGRSRRITANRFLVSGQRRVVRQPRCRGGAGSLQRLQHATVQRLRHRRRQRGFDRDARQLVAEADGRPLGDQQAGVQAGLQLGQRRIEQRL